MGGGKHAVEIFAAALAALGAHPPETRLETLFVGHWPVLHFCRVRKRHGAAHAVGKPVPSIAAENLGLRCDRHCPKPGGSGHIPTKMMCRKTVTASGVAWLRWDERGVGRQCVRKC